MLKRIQSYAKPLVNPPPKPEEDPEKGSASSYSARTLPRTGAIEKFKGQLVSHTIASQWIQFYDLNKPPIAKDESKAESPEEKATGVKHDWTFHTTSNERTSSAEGYLHNAEHRLTTVSNILPMFDLKATLTKFTNSPHYDEYTEIVTIGSRASHSPTSVNNPDLWDNQDVYVIDHFNRWFLTSEQFEQMDRGLDNGNTRGLERLYREWMQVVTLGNSHYYRPWPNSTRQCLGRKIAQQIVWDYQTTHVVKDADIEGAFSLSDCSSLLSALQKKRVSDKQCQKMIKAVIQRFLDFSPVDRRPSIRHNFDASLVVASEGLLAECGMVLCYVAWTVPLLYVPFTYFGRLQLLSRRADDGEYVPDLWKVFIKRLLKEWSDLNIILALILAANVSFLALPGTSSDTPSGKPLELADISRATSIISMFMTMSGLLTSLCLIWIHTPLLGTGSSGAYKYIAGLSYEPSPTSKKFTDHTSFIRLVWMASYLGMPLVLLLWSVIAFVVSATSWIFLYSKENTQITTALICGIVLLSPVAVLLVFVRPANAKENLFSNIRRSRQARRQIKH